ncbi:type VI secretion system protein TssA [Castellaniella hirudinis]|uniref:type VI secretion system protein TssA n=1 Tax=Castellaniella hirudinis TaxID=1144617 RepID=UPI0039C14DF7
MTLDTEPLLQAISDAAPGGADIRDGEDYDALSSEIDKLSSPTSSGQVDWSRVETIASRLLAQQSKDFMVAAWLSAAWIHRHKVEGLAAALHLFDQLVARFWDSAWPAVKRLRGRRNALIWGIDRASAWLETAEIPPLPPAEHAAMLADIQSLDSRLAELDPESPPLQALTQHIRRLEVQEEAPPAAATSPAETSAPAEGNTDTPQTDAAPAGQADPAKHPPAAVPAAAPPAKAASLPAFSPAADGLPASLDSPDAVIQALHPALDYIARLNQSLRTLAPLNPLCIDLNRLTARSTLLDAPPAQQGATALMAPPVAILDAFATIRQNNNPDGLIEFCESRLGTFPYWLDLDRESARGFGLMGPAGAPLRQAVTEHALAFAERLPGLEHLTFSDGTPFADEATRHWLAECRAERAGGPPPDRASQTQQQAQAAQAAGHPEQAIAAYQALIETTWAGRDRFLARLALLESLPSLLANATPYPLAQSLADDCLAQRLDSWEPDLARRGWLAIYRALRARLNTPSPAAAPSQDAASQALMQQAQLALAGLAPGLTA